MCAEILYASVIAEGYSWRGETISPASSICTSANSTISNAVGFPEKTHRRTAALPTLPASLLIIVLDNRGRLSLIVT